MLVQSKFRSKVAGPVIIIVMIVGLIILISVIWSWSPEFPVWPMLFFYIPTIFLGCMMIFGELRRRVLKVTIDKETITVRRYMGWGKEELHFLNTFDGYQLTHLQSRYGSYEYLYLIRDGKRVIKLSDFYHKNFEELKSAIAAKVKYNGWLEYNFAREIRQFFE